MDVPQASVSAQWACGSPSELFKHGLEADLTRPFKFDKKLEAATRVPLNRRKPEVNPPSVRIGGPVPLVTHLPPFPGLKRSGGTQISKRTVFVSIDPASLSARRQQQWEAKEIVYYAFGGI